MLTGRRGAKADVTGPVVALGNLGVIVVLKVLIVVLYNVHFTTRVVIPFVLTLFVTIVLGPLIRRVIH